jgi:3-methyladenine DNA glycosylase AlkC
MAEQFQVRDLFSPAVVTRFAEDIHAVWRPFPKADFLQGVIPYLSGQSFSERLRAISIALEKALPTDFPKAVDILLKALPEPMHPSEYGGTSHFIIAPQTAFISRCGMAHFDLSMDALREMTRRFTSEWDVRFFFEADPEKTRQVLMTWAADQDMHVRRLVSEGTRPYVPWGKKLLAVENNPSLSLDLLDQLKNDPTEYVRRSVANHLNDLSKKHPELVVQILTRWRKEHPGAPMEKLIRHATRTLVKKGHPRALALLGYQQGAKIDLVDFKLKPKKIKMGESIELSFGLVSTSKKVQKLVIDYVVYFVKSNGTHSPKVFKMKSMDIRPGETVTLSKKHVIRPITTRVYYPGAHFVTVQINGQEYEKLAFELVGI